MKASCCHSNFGNLQKQVFHGIVRISRPLIMGKKKIFSTRLDVDRLKDLKHLAVDTDKSLGNLLEEAIKDIVDKYKKKIRK